jgi:hypothetical protein
MTAPQATETPANLKGSQPDVPVYANNIEDEAGVPTIIVQRYVAAYPHLRFIRSARVFAQNALRLAAVDGVSAADLWRLAAVANGERF